MPQLNYHFFAPQIFWLIVSILLLYFFLYRFILPKMSSVFEERSIRISSIIKTVKESESESTKIENEYKERLLHAKKTVAINLSATTNEIAKQMSEKTEHAQIECTKMLKDSEKKISLFKSLAIKEVQEMIPNISCTAIRALSGIKVDENEIKPLIKLKVK